MRVVWCGGGLLRAPDENSYIFWANSSRVDNRSTWKSNWCKLPCVPAGDHFDGVKGQRVLTF